MIMINLTKRTVQHAQTTTKDKRMLAYAKEAVDLTIHWIWHFSRSRNKLGRRRGIRHAKRFMIS